MEEDKLTTGDTFTSPCAPEVVQPNNEGVKPVNATVVVDPNTGMNRVVSDEYAYKNEAGQPITDLKKSSELKSDENIFDTDDFNDVMKNRYRISRIEAIMELKQLASDYENGKITSGLYAKLPSEFKSMISGMGVPATDKAMLNKVAKELLEEVISEFKFDTNLTEEFNDLQRSIKAAIDEINVGEAAMQYSDEQMNGIDILIEKYKDDPEKLSKVMDIKEPYDDAVSFNRLREKAREIKNLRKFVKTVDRYERECDSFNYKYKCNHEYNFAITDVKAMGLTLKRQLKGTEYIEDDICKFVMLFTRTCLNYDADVIRDHVFMYYTIKTVVMLDVLSPESDRFKQIINNVKDVINIIKEEEKK